MMMTKPGIGLLPFCLILLGAGVATGKELFHPSEGAKGVGSVSVGTVTSGFLVNGRVFPLQGPHHRLLPACMGRNLRTATDELEEAILQAADQVARRFPGSTLQLGNFAAPRGGDIPYSVSHNSGRDVDMVFYFRDSRGRIALPDTMEAVDAKGLTPSGLRLDGERTWALLRSLLRNRSIRVQWIFVSCPAKRIILTAAVKARDPVTLIQKADAVMAQPGRAIPHDDHIHLRVYCSQEDAALGCQDIGIRHSWAPATAAARDRALRQSLRSLRSSDDQERLRCVALMAYLGHKSHGRSIAKLLRDPQAEVRRRSADTLVTLLKGEARDHLVQALEREREGDVALSLVAHLLGMPGKRAPSSTLRRLLLASKERVVPGEPPLRASVADLLAKHPDPAALPFLIELIDDQVPEVRASVHTAIGRITNQEIKRGGWFLPTAEARLMSEAKAAWKRWWRTKGRHGREQWVREGFHRLGIDPTAAKELIAAITGPDHISFNARMALIERYKRGGATLEQRPQDAQAYWEKPVGAGKGRRTPGAYRLDHCPFPLKAKR